MRRRLFISTGVSVAIVAVLPPVHALSERLLSAHMIQHLAMMIVAAPLIALGLPRTLRVGAIPLWIVATATLWAWHLPVLYDAALGSPVLHGIEHISFIVTSVGFWAFVLTRADGSALARVGLTFATALQSSALGALLAFASTPLYSSHVETAGSRTPLEDQQLAGALMWVPPGVVYLAVMLVLLYRWFAQLDATSDPRPAREGLS